MLIRNDGHESVVLEDMNTRLVITPVNDGLDSADVHLSVSTELDLRHRIDLGTRQLGDLMGLLDEIRREWQGWKGKKLWASADSRLALEVVHDHRATVIFKVTSHAMRYPADWGCTAQIVYELGALETLMATEGDQPSPSS
jgi:hypothetical protein